jgi:hypothetical protein
MIRVWHIPGYLGNARLGGIAEPSRLRVQRLPQRGGIDAHYQCGDRSDLAFGKQPPRQIELFRLRAAFD